MESTLSALHPRRHMSNNNMKKHQGLDPVFFWWESSLKIWFHLVTSHFYGGIQVSCCHFILFWLGPVPRPQEFWDDTISSLVKNQVKKKLNKSNVVILSFWRRSRPKMVCPSCCFTFLGGVSKLVPQTSLYNAATLPQWPTGKKQQNWTKTLGIAPSHWRTLNSKGWFP